MAEIQQQLAHPNQHMNTGDVIQIEAPDFDPDIDEALPISTAQNIDHKNSQQRQLNVEPLLHRTKTSRT